MHRLPYNLTCELYFVPGSMEKVLRILDQHCYEENEKLKDECGEKRSAASSEFDFVYLPIDFG